jgi:DNA-binding NarL/FixJ family response regulator
VNATIQGCGLILVADADGTTRAALCRLLGAVGLETVQAANGEDALAVARATHPDLAVLDVDLPLLSGYEVCRGLKDELGDRIAVVFVSADRVEPRDRVAGLYLGGDDYVTKPFDAGELVARVRRLLPGGGHHRAAAPGVASLTAREREVLELLAQGRSQAAIAANLGITSKTVANHLQNVLGKLGAHSRAEAVALAYQEGVV